MTTESVIRVHSDSGQDHLQWTKLSTPKSPKVDKINTWATCHTILTSTFEATESDLVHMSTHVHYPADMSVHPPLLKGVDSPDLDIGQRSQKQATRLHQQAPCGVEEVAGR